MLDVVPKLTSEPPSSPLEWALIIVGGLTCIMILALALSFPDLPRTRRGV
jgi:hypothetical protein